MEFITRPYIAYELNKKHQAKVISSIEYGKLGHYKYEIVLSNTNFIWEYHRINAYPLYFYLDMSRNLNIDRNLQVSKIIREYIELKLHIKCSNCTTIYFEDHIRYYPLGDNRDMIYLTEDEQVELRIDFTSYIGMYLIPSDYTLVKELSPICDEKALYSANVKELGLFPGYQYKNGIPCYNDSIFQSVSGEELEGRRTSRVQLEARKKFDYLSLKVNLPQKLQIIFGQIETLDIYGEKFIKMNNDRLISVQKPKESRKEKSEKFSIPTIKSVTSIPAIKRETSIHAKNEDVNDVLAYNPFYGINYVETSWSLSRILTQVNSGELPSIIIIGEWRHEEKTIELRKKINYLSKYAYLKEYSEYEISKITVDNVRTLPDLSVNIPIITLDKLDNIIKFISDNFTSFDYKDSQLSKRSFNAHIKDFDEGNMKDQWKILLNNYY